ncbi:unnamed protein product [Prorocentrum cordatum]|uniref:Copper type II ascorbate-dependent monooxygenase C-terminal domain-containing protein n=1 Tax=Prorocentrum cordatum TaxID=2364126 RepID=A0ABN9S6G9_9DINO|nr:unnamed protein product [Polarella glacialis]
MREIMPRGCDAMKWPWAVGSDDVVFPENVVMPFGENVLWMALQVHYCNPLLDAGCTNIWDVPSINVLGVVYHGHLVGKSFNIDVASSVDGSYRGTLRREKRYDFNHQSLEPRLLKTISRRDELTFTCKYDTSSRTELTAFGELTQNGTCWSAFTYYPAQAKEGRRGTGRPTASGTRAAWPGRTTPQSCPASPSAPTTRSKIAPRRFATRFESGMSLYRRNIQKRKKCQVTSPWGCSGAFFEAVSGPKRAPGSEA